MAEMEARVARASLNGRPPDTAWIHWCGSGGLPGYEVPATPIELGVRGLIKGLNRLNRPMPKTLLDHVRFAWPVRDHQFIAFVHIDDEEIFAEVMRWVQSPGITLYDEPEKFESTIFQDVQDALRSLRSSQD